MTYKPCVCILCGTGCGQFLKTDGKTVVGVSPHLSHPVSKGKLCLRGWHINEVLNTHERITTPLIRENGALREASYEEAIDLVVNRMAQFDGFADEIGVIASARSSNENGFTLKRLARDVFRTGVIGISSEAGHKNSLESLSYAFGHPGAVGRLTSIDTADYILVVGTDITRQNPIIGGNIHAAARRGARVVTICSARTQIAKLSTRHYQQKPGNKRLLINALAKARHGVRIVSRALPDEVTRLPGYSEYVEQLRAISSVALEAASGIRYEDIEAEAQHLARANSVVILFSSGISGLDKDTIDAIANLALLTGKMDNKDSALIPVCGICNLQGSFDMGLGGEPGKNVFDHIADETSSLRALFVVDHDDGIIRHKDRIAALDFVVYSGAYKNPFMELAHVIFPLTSFNEADGTYTASDRRVQITQKTSDNARGATPLWQLNQHIAQRAGQPWNYQNAADVFKDIAREIPGYIDMDHERLARGFGEFWQEKAYPTAGQKRFHAVEIKYPEPTTSPEFPYALMIGKAQHFWHQNNLMRKTLIPRREYDATLLSYPQGYIEICPEDAKALKVKHTWRVKVSSSLGTSMTIAVNVSSDVQPGTAYIPYFIKSMISDFLIRYDEAFSAGEEGVIPIRIEEA
jgi:predicted molibdopterin-dependent oxidoreductase YjgC